MARNARAAACAEVSRTYPLLAGVEPTMQRAGPHLVYTFRGPRAEGAPAPIVRVTVDEGGGIVRVVASR